MNLNFSPESPQLKVSSCANESDFELCRKQYDGTVELKSCQEKSELKSSEDTIHNACVVGYGEYGGVTPVQMTQLS